MKYCINCGHELPDHAMFCSNCGAKQPVQEQTPAQQQSAVEPEVVYEEVQVEESKKEKPKTDLSAYMKIKTFAIWGIAPLVFLIINVIFGSIGILQIFTVLFQLFLSVLGIVMNTINFVKRINRKIFDYEFGAALAFAALDSVSFICAFIFVVSL